MSNSREDMNPHSRGVMHQIPLLLRHGRASSRPSTFLMRPHEGRRG